MSRYIITFSKEGYAKYTSHLDVNRLFRRSIRKQGLTLAYSQGFNPHPKMSFGQPLSLGYGALKEHLEIETVDSYQPWFIKDRLSEVMPEGIKILDCKPMESGIKSLAAIADYACYDVYFKTEMNVDKLQDILESYLAQNEIVTLKTSKKKKEPVKVNIKEKIRSLSIDKNENTACLSMNLDCGSISNLSPELVISTFMEYSGLNIERSLIEVIRTKIGYKNFEI